MIFSLRMMVEKSDWSLSIFLLQPVVIGESRALFLSLDIIRKMLSKNRQFMT
jgi:hypothetical protein